MTLDVEGKALREKLRNIISMIEFDGVDTFLNDSVVGECDKSSLEDAFILLCTEETSDAIERFFVTIRTELWMWYKL
jgi:hypothetical protein